MSGQELDLKNFPNAGFLLPAGFRPERAVFCFLCLLDEKPAWFEVDPAHASTALDFHFLSHEKDGVGRFITCSDKQKKKNIQSLEGVSP
jgi:hypothetical protein